MLTSFRYLALLAALPLAGAPLALRDVKPIDAHTHIYSDNPVLRDILQRLNLTIVNVTVVDPYEHGLEKMEPQHHEVIAVSRANPGRAPWIGTFDAAEWESPGFADRVKRGLDEEFKEGALGVKIYKTIGMELQSKSGRYVMPDDPAFSPILDFVAARGKTLYAHIAEPIGAWNPYDPADPDASYYKEFPHWSMVGKPGKPSKATILAARDRMLAAHPNLRVVGCHLGSMEDNVDVVARHFDQYPNLAVDTAGRVTHLALQPRDKVRAFIIKYQDRILYATDEVLIPDQNAAQRLKSWEEELQRDWKFFATTGQVEYMGRKFTGLGLPEPVLRKIYRENALKWVPGIAASGQKGRP